MKKENLLPLNLQFFAENPDADPSPDDKGTSESKDDTVPKDESPEKEDPKGDDSEKKEPTAQELMIEVSRLKRQLDKTSSEAKEWKEKFRSTQSEKEILDAEKAEAEAARLEEFEAMKKQLKVNEFTENFMALGYSKDLAKQAATAQVDGDTETLFKIQSDVQAQIIKPKESEWLASRPELKTGGQPKEEDDPFIKGFNSVKQYH